MNLTTETVGNVVIVNVPGEKLDAGNAKALKEELTAVLQPGAKLVFDLSTLCPVKLIDITSQELHRDQSHRSVHYGFA